jgi:hypothetical protein
MLLKENGGKSKFAEGAGRDLERLIEGGLDERTVMAGSTWSAVDLEPYKRGDRVIESPRFLLRNDDRALIYPGRPHVFYGESESLKSWAALEVCREVVAAGFTALYVDFEGSEASFVERCRLAGVPDAMIGGALRYMHPGQPLTGAGVDGTLARSDWESELGWTTGLVVLDGVSECYALHGWNVNSAEDAARFQHTFAVDGPAGLSIDHTAKDAGRGVLGSQHKRAGLDGAEYEFRSRVRAGRGGESMAEIYVTKDRHGWIREWAPTNGMVGKLWVRPNGVSLEAPGHVDLIDPRDDALDRVLEFVRDNPGLSKKKIRAGVRLQCKRVDAAIDTLEAQGKIANHGSRSKGAWHVT